MGLWCYGRYGKGYRSCQVEKMDSKEISNRINISKNTFSRIGINLQKNQIKSDEIGDWSRTDGPKSTNWPVIIG